MAKHSDRVRTEENDSGGCESDHHTLLFLLINAVKRLPRCHKPRLCVLFGWCVHQLVLFVLTPLNTVWVLISQLVGGSFETAICILTR